MYIFFFKKNAATCNLKLREREFALKSSVKPKWKDI